MFRLTVGYTRYALSVLSARGFAFPTQLGHRSIGPEGLIGPLARSSLLR